MRVFLIIIFFVANTLFARWYYVCQILHKCATTSVVPAGDVRLNTLQLTEGDTVLLEGFDQFAFDSTSVLPRLNDNNSLFLDTLGSYLNLFPQKSLIITGLYRTAEAGLQAGMYENIGIARADAVRRLLLKRGIPEERIKLDYNSTTDSLLQEPITFKAYLPSIAIPSAFEKLQFSFTNMTFSDANFEFNSDVFRPGEPFKLYADSLKTYLDVHKDKALTIIGHTDNIGSKNFNKTLGMKRAINTKAYLIKNSGIKSTIKLISEGEARPTASNDTEEGRQKNRRVNFIIE